MSSTDAKKPRESYHHGDLKAQLIEATRQLVEEKGPDHFSVSEACRRAGVSTAAPYKHFSDKEAMLRAVAMDGMERHHGQMREALKPLEPGTLDRINALGRIYVQFAMTEPGVFRLMFGLSEDHAEHAELVDKGTDTFGMVQLEVARCHGREEITEADVTQAFMLWSFVHGLSFLQIDGKLTAQKMPVGIDIILNEISRRVVTPA